MRNLLVVEALQANSQRWANAYAYNESTPPKLCPAVNLCDSSLPPVIWLRHPAYGGGATTRHWRDVDSHRRTADFHREAERLSTDVAASANLKTGRIVDASTAHCKGRHHEKGL